MNMQDLQRLRLSTLLLPKWWFPSSTPYGVLQVVKSDNGPVVVPSGESHDPVTMRRRVAEQKLKIKSQAESRSAVKDCDILVERGALSAVGIWVITQPHSEPVNYLGERQLTWVVRAALPPAFWSQSGSQPTHLWTQVEVLRSWLNLCVCMCICAAKETH